MPAQRPVFNRAATVTLFLCGDVMTGRGIDQILSHPGDPSLHEPFVGSAVEYVRLAEEATGSIPRSVDPAYVWGEALDEFRRVAPDLRVINLETAVTTSNDYDRTKQVHYRMHPANIGCLTAACVQCCALANNHVLDWGQTGSLETLESLVHVGIAAVGAGRNLEQAMRPGVFDLPGKYRVLVFACGCESAGVPLEWAATDTGPGIWLVDENSSASLDNLAAVVRRTKQPTDLVVVSIHWGGNWGYQIPGAHREFAHALIDRAGVDVIHDDSRGQMRHPIDGRRTGRRLDTGISQVQLITWVV